MARHRVPLSRVQVAVRDVLWGLAVLAGCTVGGVLLAGAIWLACQLPGDSSEGVNLAPISAVMHAP